MPKKVINITKPDNEDIDAIVAEFRRRDGKQFRRARAPTEAPTEKLPERDAETREKAPPPPHQNGRQTRATITRITVTRVTVMRISL